MLCERGPLEIAVGAGAGAGADAGAGAGLRQRKGQMGAVSAVSSSHHLLCSIFITPLVMEYLHHTICFHSASLLMVL